MENQKEGGALILRVAGAKVRRERRGSQDTDLDVLHTFEDNNVTYFTQSAEFLRMIFRSAIRAWADASFSQHFHTKAMIREKEAAIRRCFLTNALLTTGFGEGSR